MKRLLPLIMILILLFQTVSFAETPIKILLDDTQIVLSSQPVVISGVTLVPISDILRPIGAEIGWNSTTQTATIKKDSTEIVIVIGQNYATVNGNKINLALPARLQSGRTMIPLRFVSESLGYNVQWDGVNRKIFVDTRIPNGAKIYYSGMYKLGSDIQTGLYKLIAEDMAYVAMSKDSTGDFSSLIRNAIITNSGYFQVNSEDAFVKVTSAKFFAFDYNNAKPNLLSEIKSGVYLVGIDLAPGEYKVVPTDSSMGYTARLSDLNGGLDSIIANEIYQGQGYVQILPTDYAIEISGCVLNPVK